MSRCFSNGRTPSRAGNIETSRRSWPGNGQRAAPGEREGENDAVFATFLRWVESTSAYIHTLDPHHLVTTGSEGNMGCLNTDENFGAFMPCRPLITPFPPLAEQLGLVPARRFRGHHRAHAGESRDYATRIWPWPMLSTSPWCSRIRSRSRCRTGGRVRDHESRQVLCGASWNDRDFGGARRRSGRFELLALGGEGRLRTPVRVRPTGLAPAKCAGGSGPEHGVRLRPKHADNLRITSRKCERSPRQYHARIGLEPAKRSAAFLAGRDDSAEGELSLDFARTLTHSTPLRVILSLPAVSLSNPSNG